MDELAQKFYDVLVSHNHEIVMSGEWLANVARELAEAAQQSVQADGLTICQNCGSWLRAGECENCISPIAPARR